MNTNNHQTQTNILISSCLLGNPVRYNGKDLLINHPLLLKWQQQKRLIPICPEVAGGLSVPRAPAEIVNQSLILNNDNQDVTAAFMLGAKKALQQAQNNQCIAAILTEASPSCGSHEIYDGSFTRTKIVGMGITTALLRKNNIAVFNQTQLEQLEEYLHNKETFTQEI